MSQSNKLRNITLLLYFAYTISGCKTIAPNTTYSGKNSSYSEAFTEDTTKSSIEVTFPSLKIAESDIYNHLPYLLFKSDNLPDFSHGSDCPLQWKYYSIKSQVKLTTLNNKLLYSSDPGYFVHARHSYLRAFGCCKVTDDDCGSDVVNGYGILRISGSIEPYFDKQLRLKLQNKITSVDAVGEGDFWLNLYYDYTPHVKTAINTSFAKMEELLNQTDYSKVLNDICYFLNNNVACHDRDNYKNCFTLNLSSVNVPSIDFEPGAEGARLVTKVSIFGTPKYLSKYEQIDNETSINTPELIPDGLIYYKIPLSTSITTIEQEIQQKLLGYYRYGKMFYKHVNIINVKVTGYTASEIFFSVYFDGPVLKGYVNLVSNFKFNESSNLCEINRIRIDNGTLSQIRRKKQIQLFNHVLRKLEASFSLDLSPDLKQFNSEMNQQYNVETELYNTEMKIFDRIGHTILMSDQIFYVLKRGSAKISLQLKGTLN